MISRKNILRKNKKGFTPTPKFGVSLRSKRGFTLVELLIVVAIIGLLVSMAMIRINQTKTKARDSRRVGDISNIATALALYHNDRNRYPVYEGAIDGSPTDVLSAELKNAGLMSVVPLDPLNRDVGGCGTAGGYHYYYVSNIDGSNYILWYCLETNSILGKTSGPNGMSP